MLYVIPRLTRKVLAFINEESGGEAMFAPRKLSSTPTTSPDRRTITRLVLMDNLAQETIKDLSTKHSHNCRCPEQRVNPEIFCPSHWLSIEPLSVQFH
jgi:hypothetical protein